MKIKTNELTGVGLDWAVEAAILSTSNMTPRLIAVRLLPENFGSDRRAHSTSWSQGGSIVEREGISLKKNTIAPKNHMWGAYSDCMQFRAFGPTPLIAAMRCFVASKLGDEVDVPDELVGGAA